MIRIKFSEKSIRTIMANCRRLELNSRRGAKKALKEVAENIMAQSKSECPIETGTLQSSAYITNPVDWGDRVTIIMGYGGPKDKLNPIPDKITGKMKMASDYALAVHETPYYKHPYGKWKFLEDPVRAHTKAFIATLAKELRIVFAPGIKGR